jgi:hypothetical protein
MYTIDPRTTHVRALAYNEVVSIRNKVNLNNPNAVSYGFEYQKRRRPPTYSCFVYIYIYIYILD